MPKKITNIPTYATPTGAVLDNIETVGRFCDDFGDTLHDTGMLALGFCECLLSLFYRVSGGLYRDRLVRWANLADVTPRRLLLTNVMYELAQAGATSPFGCTSVVMDTPKDGIVHIRNMDWELLNMGRSTVVIDGYDYTAVSNPGLLGALSGMVADEFSITLNWAPPSEVPCWKFGPLFLLQYILENATTYAEAVELARDTPLSTPALFTIAGAADACVVERTQKYYKIRNLTKGKPLVTTNHYVTSAMKEYNDYQENDINTCSRARYRDAMKQARAMKGDDFHEVLSTEETLHEGTIQQMVFYPSTGNYSVIAFDNNKYLRENLV